MLTFKISSLATHSYTFVQSILFYSRKRHLVLIPFFGEQYLSFLPHQKLNLGPND